ncbi:hypothetical protein MNV49_005279 [Pseudohyphozyma bogoriensis]|nr:hypothetical protein MNV49_005279 [Pseudohyphozyma bogoriensis]
MVSRFSAFGRPVLGVIMLFVTAAPLVCTSILFAPADFLVDTDVLTIKVRILAFLVSHLVVVLAAALVFSLQPAEGFRLPRSLRSFFLLFWIVDAFSNIVGCRQAGSPDHGGKFIGVPGAVLLLSQGGLAVKVLWPQLETGEGGWMGAFNRLVVRWQQRAPQANELLRRVPGMVGVPLETKCKKSVLLGDFTKMDEDASNDFTDSNDHSLPSYRITILLLAHAFIVAAAGAAQYCNPPGGWPAAMQLRKWALLGWGTDADVLFVWSVPNAQGIGAGGNATIVLTSLRFGRRHNGHKYTLFTIQQNLLVNNSPASLQSNTSIILLL